MHYTLGLYVGQLDKSSVNRRSCCHRHLLSDDRTAQRSEITTASRAMPQLLRADQATKCGIPFLQSGFRLINISLRHPLYGPIIRLLCFMTALYISVTIPLSPCSPSIS